MKEYEAKLAKHSAGNGRPEGLQQGRYARAGPRSSASMMEKANLLRLELNAPARVQSFQKAAVPDEARVEEATPRHGRRRR